MSEQPWETHDRLCPNRRPTVAFPNSACSGCRAVVAARAEGYARGLIEGDSGGRREGYRSGYDTAWSLSAAEIERQTLDAARDAVGAELASYRADCINDNKIISLIAVDTFRHTMRTIDALTTRDEGRNTG